MSPSIVGKPEKRKRADDQVTSTADLVEKKSKKEKKVKKDKSEKKDKKDKKVKKEEKEKAKGDSENKGNAISTIADLSSSYQYTEHPALAALPESKVTEYLKEHAITIECDKKFRPIMEFQYAGLPDKLMGVFKNFSKPTPIQAATWPITLSGHDIVGIAETGSGKTYAFTIPGLVNIASKLKTGARKPSMLVVSPTRELAVQTDEQAKLAGKAAGVSTICLYGGVSMAPQEQALARGVDIVVATPGRLKDLINRGNCDLSEVSFLVLDEADRMLDDGFEKDIKEIIDFTPKNRQTLMFSATWPESVRNLASNYLTKPMRVTIGSDELTASQNVTQIVEVLDREGKKNRLMSLLKKIHKSGKNRILIFALYKKEAAYIENYLRAANYQVIGIHGDKNQTDRSKALEMFKSGSAPLMVATDVAARGLDIPDVEYVVNYTFPLTIEAYIHRIGRTGRGGKKGTAYTFFTPDDKNHSGELINVLKQANMDVPESLLKFGTTVKKKQHGAYGAFFKDTSDAVKPTKIVFGDD